MLYNNNKIYSVMRKTLYISAGCCAVSVPAFAENTESRYKLEEVLVTAQKRVANLQDVPISVASFSGKFIADNNITDIQDLSNMTPSLTIGQSGQTANNRISIRGVGSDGNNSLDPSVALYINGVYVARPGAMLGDLLDIGSVDILRGPQGTLFGRNSTMGVLDLHTNKPTNDREAKAAVTLGDYNTRKIQGVFNTPISDELAMRVAVGHSQRDGYGDNVLTGDDKDTGSRNADSARVSMLYTPTESIEVNWSVDYSHTKRKGNVLAWDKRSYNDPDFDRSGNLNTSLAGNAPIVNGDLYKINQVNDDRQDDKNLGTALIIEAELDNGGILRSVTGYRDWENEVTETDGLRTPLDLLSRSVQFDSKSWSQEINYLSPEDESPFSYVTGLYYFHEDFDIDEDWVYGQDFCSWIVNDSFASAGLKGLAVSSGCAAGGGTTQSFSQTAKSYAAFGQGSYDITDTFIATLGVRFTHDEKDASYSSDQIQPFGRILRAVEDTPDMEYDEDNTTWFANLQYNLTQDIMLFGTVSTGYKAGGFNAGGASKPFTADQRSFAPEEVINYEVGAKTTLWGGRATANLTLFRTDIDDFQERSYDADAAAFSIKNAGELRQQGIEFDLDARLLQQLTLTAAFVYLDSEYLDFKSATGLPGTPAGTLQDLTGERAPYSPKWTFSLSPEWRDTLGSNGLEWFVKAEYFYNGKQSYSSSSDGNPQVVFESYDLLNFRAGLEEDNWRVTVFVQNASDEVYFQRTYYQALGNQFGVVDNVNNTTQVIGNLGVPRTVGVSLGYDF